MHSRGVLLPLEEDLAVAGRGGAGIREESRGLRFQSSGALLDLAGNHGAVNNRHLAGHFGLNPAEAGDVVQDSVDLTNQLRFI